MTDTVLQSFCERCGRRFTFAEPRARRESGLSRLGRSLGLRGGKDVAEESTVSTALPTHDPFQGTFSFCLQCRQYTCSDCWNHEAGLCRSCAPSLDASDPLYPQGPASEAATEAALVMLDQAGEPLPPPLRE